MRYLFIICLLLIRNLSIAQDCTFQANFDKALYHIYNFEFDEALKESNRISNVAPEEAIFLKMENLWWEMICSPTNKNDSTFIRYLSSVPKLSSYKESRDIKLIYYSYLARYFNFKHQFFKKTSILIKLHNLLKYYNVSGNHSTDTFIESYRSLSVELYNYLELITINKIIPFSGNTSSSRLAILYKIESIQSDNFESFETIKTYILGKIYLEIEGDQDLALKKFQELTQMFPKNTIFKNTVDKLQNVQPASVVCTK